MGLGATVGADLLSVPFPKMVFDLARIGVREDEVSNDGPAGAPRRVQGADGVHHVIVAGQVVLDHGRHTGALPGRVLRAARRG